VKLADFGTTIWCDGYQQDNSPRGTEAFMAPEVNVNCFCCTVHVQIRGLLFSNPCLAFRLSNSNPFS